MDVKHHDDVTNYHLPEGLRSKVCQKTITYQLDGHVGLLADLALMAQAAAHAREVCATRTRIAFELTTFVSIIGRSLWMIPIGIVESEPYVESSVFGACVEFCIDGQTISKIFGHGNQGQKRIVALLPQKVCSKRVSHDPALILLIFAELVACPRSARYVLTFYSGRRPF